MPIIGFIGGGNMGEALIRGIISAKLYAPSNVLVSDARKDRLEYLREAYGIMPMASNAEVAKEADVLVLSVKPQNMDEVLTGIKGMVKETAVVISIAAAITTERIAGYLGDIPIIRAMPNTPAMVDEGATAVVIRNTGPRHFKTGLDVFAAVGKVEVLEDESLMDVVTAVSGSGPAYFFLLMEEMIAAAGEMGLPTDVAKELVFQTAKGAGLLAEMAYSRNETPAQLRERVTSPGGTTEAAVKVFRRLDFHGTINAALTAARDRSRELSAGGPVPGHAD